jgi:serine/threonine protein kinase
MKYILSPSLKDPLDLEKKKKELEIDLPVIQSLSESFKKSYPDMYINPVDFSHLELLGEGPFGITLTGMYQGNKVTVKQLNPDRLSLEHIKRMEAKVKLYAGNHSDHAVCKIYGAWLDYDPANGIFPSIVREYLPYSLKDYSKIARSLSMEQVRFIFLEVARVLKTIQHDNIKATNILLTEDLKPKLVDFKMYEDEPLRDLTVQFPTTNRLLVCYFIAPSLTFQAFDACNLRSYCATWAFACVLYTFLTGDPDTVPMVMSQPRKMLEGFPQPWASLLTRCLEPRL